MVLAAAGSFLLPPDLFLLVNLARTEIVELRSKRSDLQLNLANEQEKRHASERDLIGAKSAVEGHRNALIELVRQHSSPELSSELLAPDMETHLRRTEQLLEANNHQKAAMRAALKTLEGAKLDLDVGQKEFNLSESLISSLEEELRAVSSRLHDLTRQSNDQYLAMRAVSLGALGAFAAALAALLHGAKVGTRLHHGRTMLSMVFGGIVALVIFALFTTRELTVFASVGATANETADYWRVVIVCLVAGAFADRLFVAARERVYQATRSQDQSGNDAPPSQGEKGDQPKA